jgi:hypothetical protein
MSYAVRQDQQKFTGARAAGRILVKFTSGGRRGQQCSAQRSRGCDGVVTLTSQGHDNNGNAALSLGSGRDLVGG